MVEQSLNSEQNWAQFQSDGYDAFNPSPTFSRKIMPDPSSPRSPSNKISPLKSPASQSFASPISDENTALYKDDCSVEFQSSRTKKLMPINRMIIPPKKNELLELLNSDDDDDIEVSGLGKINVNKKSLSKSDFIKSNESCKKSVNSTDLIIDSASSCLLQSDLGATDDRCSNSDESIGSEPCADLHLIPPDPFMNRRSGCLGRILHPVFGRTSCVKSSHFPSCCQD